MKQIFFSLFVLIICFSKTSGQAGKDLPLIEDFERKDQWPWPPWIIGGNFSSSKTGSAAHSGAFGLRALSQLYYRTDKILGTPAQAISWWIRFEIPSVVYCGFGVTPGLENQFYLSVSPYTTSLRFTKRPVYGTDLKLVSQTYKMHIWYRVEVTFNTTTNVTGKLYASDGTTLMNSITLEIPGLVPGGTALRGDGGVHVDDIRGGTRIKQTSGSAPLTPKMGEHLILKNILFEMDKSKLLTQSYTELDKLVEYLKLNPKTKIEISGHTDNIGNEDHNKNLSKARAKAVAEYLTQNGIDKSNVTSIGCGSSKPIATNDTEEGRQKNRRVDFIINKK